MPEKRNETAERGRSGTPPHQPCTDYELPKVECRTPLSPALQSNCFRRCCWKVPYKGCKGVMKGKAPTIERERRDSCSKRQDTARHSKDTTQQDTRQQDTRQQDTIQKNKTIQPLQTIDKLDDALGLAKCSQEISFTPLSPCSNSWENKETK